MRTLQADSYGQARFLIIRRDNIGDLVCTTPLIQLLRERFPKAYIAALVNGYNKGVLTGNPHLDAVHHYTKAKHARGHGSVLGVYLDRLKLIWKLRRQGFNFIILGNSTYQAGALRFARFIGARHVIGYAPKDGIARTIDTPIHRNADEAIHEVIAVNRLLAPFDIDNPSPPVRVYPNPHQVERMRKLLNLSGDVSVIGIHISARLPQGRWQLEKFIELITRLSSTSGREIFLFWSPGDEKDTRHPGDDVKAKEILERCGSLPVRAYPTRELEELIVGLSLCHAVVCSDGGAMHIAAGLDKKIVALFGESPERWHPWQARHVLLRAVSRQVSDISVDEVMDAYGKLMSGTE